MSAVVAYLSGELRQRRTGVGWASLRDVPTPLPEPELRVDAVLEVVAGLTGAGSPGERVRQVSSLLARATGAEQRLLRGALGPVAEAALARGREGLAGPR